MDTPSKVDILKDQIAAIEQRITINAEAVYRLKIQVETADFQYLQARKDSALENSAKNIKARETACEESTRLKAEIEAANILALALVDELARLQSELSKAEHERALEIVTVAGKKAAKLIDTYNKSMIAAHEALYRLKVIVTIGQRFKLENELLAACPGCPSVMSLCGLPALVTLEVTSSGSYRHLFDSEYDQQAILAELMTVQPIPALPGRKSV